MNGLVIHIPLKRHADRVLFENFSMELKPGEFVCLVGPSGCGKTTLLNMVAGLDQGHKGAITFGEGGTPRLGYVFQEPRLLPWCTVAENIRLALPPDIDPHSIEPLLEQVGLACVMNLYPRQLSLGMSRRVALVRAFAINPDILLMDEPLVSLDPPTARKIRELIIALWQNRPHTVLFVTHDLREAIELADRLIFLSSSPCRICVDMHIPMSRDERDENRMEAFRKSLRQDYPDLEGIL